MSFPFSFLLI